MGDTLVCYACAGTYDSHQESGDSPYGMPFVPKCLRHSLTGVFIKFNKEWIFQTMNANGTNINRTSMSCVTFCACVLNPGSPEPEAGEGGGGAGAGVGHRQGGETGARMRGSVLCRRLKSGISNSIFSYSHTAPLLFILTPPPNGFAFFCGNLSK